MKVEPGIYIVAVSGGVDSVCLLDMLSKQNDLELIIAHYDHGIRNHSYKDADFVQSLSKKYDNKFELGNGKLGAKASEETARKFRYEFLNKIKAKYQAKAIITAHNEDDVIETAIINLIRGTSRHGLSSLKSTNELYRPLLSISKQDIYSYANDNQLEWCEDDSNNNQVYLRNWVRANIMPELRPNSDNRRTFLKLINTSVKQNKILDKYIATLSQNIYLKDNNRDKFILLPDSIAKEVVAELIRKNKINNINKTTIVKLVNILKTAQPNTSYDIDKLHRLKIGKNKFTILRS